MPGKDFERSSVIPVHCDCLLKIEIWGRDHSGLTVRPLVTDNSRNYQVALRHRASKRFWQESEAVVFIPWYGQRKSQCATEMVKGMQTETRLRARALTSGCQYKSHFHCLLS